MVKILIASVLLSTSISAHAVESYEKTCKVWTQKIVQGNKEACSDLCPQELQFDKYSYAKGLKAAFSSQQGLTDFIAYTGRSSIIGAGADTQACNLQTLLVHWGDAKFSKATNKFGPKTRDIVIDLLDYSAVSNFKARFPRTYDLAKHAE